MVSGLRVEDRLDGVANFNPWKARIALILEENELWDIVVSTATNPFTVPTDATLKIAFMKKDVKARRIILDAVRDHIIPHISGKDHAHQMWSSLTNLYQSSNENRKMVLREKLKNTKMNKGDNMISYLTRISQVRDELGAMGEKVEDAKLVRTALNGVVKPWMIFVEFVVAREHMPTWDRLWDDFVQEETHRVYV